MSLINDICDDGPVLSPRLSRPKGITKLQVERWLSEHWSDEQQNEVGGMLSPMGYPLHDFRSFGSLS